MSATAPETRRRPSIPMATVIELVGSAGASRALVWLVFSISGIVGPLGEAFCSLAGFFVIYAALCWRLHGVLIMKDRVATAAIWSCAFIAFIPLIGVIAYVLIEGMSVALKDFPDFFVKDFNDFQSNGSTSLVGAGAAIVGSIEQVGLATVFTVPLGIFTATYIVNHPSSRYGAVVSNVVDAMFGSPAIIAGLFIYILWVEPQKTNGHTGFAASLALSVMMLPIVTRTSQEVIAVVPASLTEASLALGAPRWRTTTRVVLPTARVGLVTATILGIARVAGETAPVFFTAGGSAKFNWNPFSGPQADLPLQVDQGILLPSKNAVAEAWGVAFILVLVVLTLFILARLIGSSKPGSFSRFLTIGRPRGKEALTP
jgi:phosphate transport system permease protein